GVSSCRAVTGIQREAAIIGAALRPVKRGGPAFLLCCAVLLFRTILSLAAAASALAVMTDHRIAQATSSSASAMVQATAPPPEGTLSHAQICLRVYLPDPDRGFYRSTRFDWSGVIASLT